MITLEIIQRVWQMLESPASGGGNIEAHELDIINTPAGHPLITKDGMSRRHLLIPIKSDVKVAEDKQSAGIHIEANEWGYEGERRRYVDVICLKSHLNGIFDMMLLDVLTVLPGDFEHPDRVCRRVLNQWREFLTREISQVPEKSKLIGIWGELWMLRQLTQRAPNAINVWTGPHGGRFDYYAGTTALEVKSSLQRKGTTVTIHGHEQLDLPNGGSLFLVPTFRRGI